MLVTFAFQQFPKYQKFITNIALQFLEIGSRSNRLVNTTPQPLYPQENSVTIAQEAGWAPRLI
jgi:hypothetical protein